MGERKNPSEHLFSYSPEPTGNWMVDLFVRAWLVFTLVGVAIIHAAMLLVALSFLAVGSVVRWLAGEE